MHSLVRVLSSGGCLSFGCLVKRRSVRGFSSSPCPCCGVMETLSACLRSDRSGVGRPWTVTYVPWGGRVGWQSVVSWCRLCAISRRSVHPSSVSHRSVYPCSCRWMACGSASSPVSSSRLALPGVSPDPGTPVLVLVLPDWSIPSGFLPLLRVSVTHGGVPSGSLPWTQGRESAVQQGCPGICVPVLPALLTSERW
jgi:hypothetical protein